MRRRLVYALAIAAVIGASVAVFNSSRNCVSPFWSRGGAAPTRSGHKPLRGEQQLLPDGTALYFNGSCWTPTPQPPRDMAY